MLGSSSENLANQLFTASSAKHVWRNRSLILRKSPLNARSDLILPRLRLKSSLESLSFFRGTIQRQKIILSARLGTIIVLSLLISGMEDLWPCRNATIEPWRPIVALLFLQKNTLQLEPIRQKSLLSLDGRLRPKHFFE